MARSGESNTRRFAVTLTVESDYLESGRLDDVNEIDDSDIEGLIENYLINQGLFVDVIVEEIDE